MKKLKRISSNRVSLLGTILQTEENMSVLIKGADLHAAPFLHWVPWVTETLKPGLYSPRKIFEEPSIRKLSSLREEKRWDGSGQKGRERKEKKRKTMIAHPHLKYPVTSPHRKACICIFHLYAQCFHKLCSATVLNMRKQQRITRKIWKLLMGKMLIKTNKKKENIWEKSLHIEERKHKNKIY